MNNHNVENEKDFLNYPINSDLVNIPITTQMDNVRSTPDIADNDKFNKRNEKKRSHNKK
ncbi:MAG TPA: hypothetical protein VIM70_12960 [Clostridium sp.]|uniref:hypothetical protein n=1 Tax=Clostridium sp. TaxID=1506 RepID=UPI002F92241A